jgi:hypothetical protein
MSKTDPIAVCMLRYSLNGEWTAVNLDRPSMVVGRAPDCEIVIDFIMVSRRHARLWFDGEAWWIEDLKSRNGVVVNRRRIERHQLRNGDGIQLGDLQLTFIDLREATAGFGGEPMCADSGTGTWVGPPAGTVRGAAAPPPAPVTSRGDFTQEDAAPRDLVDCTVFAPPLVQCDEPFMVQVFAHLPDEADAAAHDAREFDEDAKRRGATSLGAEVARGSTLTFALSVPDAEIDEPIRDVVWRGRRTSVQFGVQVPSRVTSHTLLGKVLVSQNSVPIGSITFKMNLAGFASPATQRTGEARRYSQAFISYASKDRPEVLRRVQMLKSVGINFFQDVLNLEPGDRWAQELYRHIDDSDVLFLFWSTAAKESEWVAKEWQYALEKKGDDFIRPVGIEGPPIPAPPEQLQHLHFGDPILYFMRP